MITHARLLEVLTYCPDTGEFVWRAAPTAPVRAGAVAGTLSSNGYWGIQIDKRIYRAHRLAWLYVHGVWPGELDHINRIRTDNRIANLRQCDRSHNNLNMTVRSDSTSGTAGVSWYPKRKKWFTYIKLYGKRKCLGYFSDKDEAIAVRAAAKAEYMRCME